MRKFNKRYAAEAMVMPDSYMSYKTIMIDGRFIYEKICETYLITEMMWKRTEMMWKRTKRSVSKYFYKAFGTLSYMIETSENMYRITRGKKNLVIRKNGKQVYK